MSGLDLATVGDALRLWGWTSRVAAAVAEATAEFGRHAVPARVVAVDREQAVLRLPDGGRDGRLAGRLRGSVVAGSQLPATGDWVLVDPPEQGGPVRIVAVLPRTSAFRRSNRDGRHSPSDADEQVVAANVDTVFLVSGLDGDLNVRRLERYLALAWSSGADAVVVLNKADIASDLEAAVRSVEEVARGVPVVVVSALEQIGLEALGEWLRPGATIALLGSSGVGKSSLANALLGEARQATTDVREDDSRGRHTTTRRELIRLPSGALLLDTPGMRALELWDDGSGLKAAFDDVAALAARCRFGDCRHEAEPGCAVLAAIEAGELSAARLASHRKLAREVRSAAVRADPVARRSERRRWGSIQSSVRVHLRSKYGEAYED
ncbi:MAG TPA: ribosome small subunit-dependent GTPase A [Candidatus Limnocylindrales bacterium]|nr:ribosome small subunit-dependent GTPase A [Candidatus Limnocylindrales bacterium]